MTTPATAIAPKFLVSFAFTAPSGPSAKARVEALEDAMRTSDALPVYDDLSFYEPVEVVPDPAPWAKRSVLILDSGEGSDLMAALLSAIETAEEDDSAEDDDEQEEHDRLVASYRALADKLTKAIRTGLAT